MIIRTTLRYHCIAFIAIALVGCASNPTVGPIPDDCAIDRDREHDPAGNQTMADAVVVPVDDANPSVTFSSLSLCPVGDVDVFRVDGIGAGWDARIDVEIGEVRDGSLNVAISNGTTELAQRGPVAGGVATWTGTLDSTRWIEVRGDAAPAQASYALHVVLVPTAGGYEDEDSEEEEEEEEDEEEEDEEDEDE